MIALPTLRQTGGVAASRIRPRFAPVRNHDSGLLGEGFLADFRTSSSALGNRVNEVTALGVSTVYACVHYIASIMATLPLDLYSVSSSGARVKMQGHPARRVMCARPNAIMVPSDVRYAMAYNQALHHNAYAQLTFSRDGRVAEIMPLRSRNVSMRMVNGYPRYQVTSDFGSQELGFDRVMHLRGMSSDGLTGRGPLSLAANLIGLAQALEDNSSRFFSNGSRPGMIYSVPAGVTLTPEQRVVIREQLDAAHAGVENFFKTLVLEGGGKVDTARAPNDASQFDEISRRTHQQICQVFGVPPHKVQILDNATFSNIEQQQIQAVQDLFLPWCKRWEEAFAGALLTPTEQDRMYFKHNLNGLLRGDVVTRYQAHSTALQNGIMSINEVRGLEDMDAITGGDGHVRQLNMIDINAPSLA